MLSDKLAENLGFLYENAAAQIISSNGRKLYYHTWSKKESTHYYEIDFIIAQNAKLVPIEIKSSAIKKHESIDEFSVKYPHDVGKKYLFSQHDIAKDGDRQLWPIYCVPVLSD